MPALESFSIAAQRRSIFREEVDLLEHGAHSERSGASCKVV
jgi:hypothetical protein